MSSGRKIQTYLLIVDLFAMVAISLWWWRSTALPAMIIALIAATCIVWLIVFPRVRMDGFRGGWSFAGVCSRNAAILFLLALLAGFLLLTTGNKKWFSSWIDVLGVEFGVVVASRCVAYGWVKLRWRMGHVKRALILGSGALAAEVARKIDAHPELFCEITGFLGAAGDPPAIDIPAQSAASSPIPTVGIPQLVRSVGADTLIVALAEFNSPEVVKLINQCRTLGMEVVLVPQLYDLYTSRPALTNVDDLPLISMRDPGVSPVTIAVKRVMDICWSLLLLVLFSPLLLLAIVLLKVRHGKGLRVEPAVGKDGIIFAMYSLDVDRWTRQLSPFSAFLRQFRITELPQLVNVLKGDMSMVGPRPALPDVVKHYSDWQKRRLKVRPGLTGLSQLGVVRPIPSFMGPDSAPPFLFRQDLEYVLDESPLIDLALLLETPWTLIKRFIASTRAAHSHARGGQGTC